MNLKIVYYCVDWNVHLGERTSGKHIYLLLQMSSLSLMRRLLCAHVPFVVQIFCFLNQNLTFSTRQMNGGLIYRVIKPLHIMCGVCQLDGNIHSAVERVQCGHSHDNFHSGSHMQDLYHVRMHDSIINRFAMGLGLGLGFRHVDPFICLCVTGDE